MSSELLASPVNTVGEDAPSRPLYITPLHFDLISSPHNVREVVLVFFRTIKDVYIVHNGYQIVVDVYASYMHTRVSVNIYQDLIEFVRTTGDGFIFSEIFMRLKAILLSENLIKESVQSLTQRRQWTQKAREKANAILARLPSTSSTSSTSSSTCVPSPFVFDPHEVVKRQVNACVEGLDDSRANALLTLLLNIDSVADLLLANTDYLTKIREAVCHPNETVHRLATSMMIVLSQKDRKCWLRVYDNDNEAIIPIIPLLQERVEKSIPKISDDSRMLLSLLQDIKIL